MTNQDNKEIWRDEATGLPIHDHVKTLTKRWGDGTESYAEWEDDPRPCRCGNAAWDMPISAKPTPKGDH